jgi:ubiquinone/menaquinone biosynthesis C-methylase UbiE
VTTDRWAGGDDYDRYVGRWIRGVAPRFLDWLGVPAGGRWVDVGCGTGALSATVLATASPASVLGIDPSADFVAHARATIADDRARLDVDHRAALRERLRATLPMAVDGSIAMIARAWAARGTA